MTLEEGTEVVILENKLSESQPLLTGKIVGFATILPEFKIYIVLLDKTKQNEDWKKSVHQMYSAIPVPESFLSLVN